MSVKTENRTDNQFVGLLKRVMTAALALLVMMLLWMRLGMACAEGALAASGSTSESAEAFLEENERVAVIDGDIQVVSSTMNGNTYERIIVYKGIPVEWTLIAPEGFLNYCNYEMVVPEYNLVVKLQEGENLIEFTPEESGIFSFGCWMDMIHSSVTVLEEDGSLAFTPSDLTRRVSDPIDRVCDCCGQ